jgi:hypothetical protein
MKYFLQPAFAEPTVRYRRLKRQRHRDFYLLENSSIPFKTVSKSRAEDIWKLGSDRSKRCRYFDWSKLRIDPNCKLQFQCPGV